MQKKHASAGLDLKIQNNLETAWQVFALDSEVVKTSIFSAGIEVS